MDTKTILAILQIPPPSHGAGFVGQQIHDSKIINSNFSIKYLRISTKSRTNKFNNKLFQVMRYLLLLLRVLKSMFKSYDLVYITPCATGLEFYKDFIICLLVKVFNKNLVYHFHNKGLESNRLVPIWIKELFLKNTNIILLSPLLKYDLGGLVPDNKIRYCPNGVSHNVQRQSNVKHNDGVTTILFLSNMIRSKGVFDLLEACKYLNHKGYNFICKFVGPWYEDIADEFFLKIATYELESKVKYLGPKYNLDKHEVFIGSDLFVFPTYYPDECFPLVLLEAMSFGLPIITTDEGAIPDIVNDEVSGLIVPKNNLELLGEAIEKLLVNGDLRKQMSQRSIQIYKMNFTEPKFEKRFVQIIQDILK